jgi:hypothetical protein
MAWATWLVHHKPTHLCTYSDWLFPANAAIRAARARLARDSRSRFWDNVDVAREIEEALLFVVGGNTLLNDTLRTWHKKQKMKYSTYSTNEEAPYWPFSRGCLPHRRSNQQWNCRMRDSEIRHVLVSNLVRCSTKIRVVLQYMQSHAESLYHPNATCWQHHVAWIWPPTHRFLYKLKMAMWKINERPTVTTNH